MGAPVRTVKSYDGKGSSSRSSAPAGLYSGKSSIPFESSFEKSSKRGHTPNSMTEIFNKLTEIGDLKQAVDNAEKAYDVAQEKLNRAVDKLHDEIKAHPSKTSIEALLTDILNEAEERKNNDFER